MLGLRLFMDTTLSRDSSISCATCHSPFRAFTESRAASHGVGAEARFRNAPSIIAIASHRPPFDWDGRAATLEEQLEGVFSVGGDMDIVLADALARVRSDSEYATLFERAFGRPPDREGFLTALVAFQQTITHGDNRFERYYLHGDSTALSPSEQRGWQLFRSSEVGCAGCHAPLPDPTSGQILFQDDGFHNLGVGYVEGRPKDLGRFRVTQVGSDSGRFRTPSLLNVELTSPYMHDGSLKTLEDVVAFYTRGGIENPHLDVVIDPFDLSRQDKADLVAFLKTLTTEWLKDSAAVHERLLRPRENQ